MISESAVQLTEKDYYTLHGEPALKDQLLRDNAHVTIYRANLVLVAMHADGVEPGIDQASHNAAASGFRPPGANSATSNAASHSTHLTCEAVDIQDWIDRRVAIWCLKNLPKMAAIGLWMEDPRWTGGRENHDPWCHWQIRGPKSGNRIYIPSVEPAGDPTFYTAHGLVKPAYLA